MMRPSSLAAAALAAVLPSGQEGCVSRDRPNPIAAQYPDYATGNLNGTTLIIPIPLDTAREVIPKEYHILEEAYRTLLPSFPAGKYPMMATAVHDHDLHVAALQFRLPDFSRTLLEFPFLDLLDDGFSSFRWAATMMITAGSPAVNGSESYGIKVYPSTFDPPCDAYKGMPDGKVTFKAVATKSADARHVAIETQPSRDHVPYPLCFMRNITNQPTFASPSKCDNYIRLYNTSLTEPPNNPVPVKGNVMLKLEPFAKNTYEWKDVYGWRMSNAFVEPPMPQRCEHLKGYHGTGPGDS